MPFGFTSSWRVFIKERRGRGLRAQMIMLALAVLLIFPLPWVQVNYLVIL